MPQSLANVLVHATFATKDRRPMLRDASLRAEMHRYLGGISNHLESPVLIIGGWDDHVHLLAQFGRTITLADWIKELKRASTLWIKSKGASFEAFQWQNGYAVFSVSQSQRPRVQNYIVAQEEHHRTRSFQEELRELLRRHRIEFDERYVWD